MGMIWGLAGGYKRPETDERVFPLGRESSGISQAGSSISMFENMMLREYQGEARMLGECK